MSERINNRVVPPKKYIMVNIKCAKNLKQPVTQATRFQTHMHIDLIHTRRDNRTPAHFSVALYSQIYVPRSLACEVRLIRLNRCANTFGRVAL